MQTDITDTPEQEQRIIKAVGKSWYPHLKHLFREGGRLEKVAKFISKRRKTVQVYPKNEEIFKAFKYTKYEDVKVVILGQDPYHTGVADGLAFSSNREGHRPPSLDNIFKAIETQLYDGLSIPLYNVVDLSHWALQGVLLLNTSLTVEHKQPNSHKKPWEGFAKEVFKVLRNHPNKIIFLLWGAEAKAYAPLLEGTHHKVVMAEHPAAASYRGATWNSNNSFKEVEAFCSLNGYEDIAWVYDDFLPF